MDFTSLMHVTFFTDQLDEMIHFYTEVMGGTLKIVTRAKAYAEKPDSHYHAIALSDPEAIIMTYIEIAPLQFIELFPAKEGQLPHRQWNDSVDYSHFALTVDDIFAARELLEKRGLSFDTEISKGPSETWKFWAHDPDGNKFEVMQFTDKSYQVVGNIM